MRCIKFFILIPVFSILFYQGVWASANVALGSESADGSPPIAVVNEKDFQFSPVIDGTTVYHEFIIHNKGETTLNISKVKTG